MTNQEKQLLEHVLEREESPMTWKEKQALVKAILEIHQVVYERIIPPDDFCF